MGLGNITLNLQIRTLRLRGAKRPPTPTQGHTALQAEPRLTPGSLASTTLLPAHHPPWCRLLPCPCGPRAQAAPRMQGGLWLPTGAFHKSRGE